MVTFTLTLLALAGCYREEFKVDVFDPRLPEYSESGRDHAGAYINGLPWRSYPRFSIFTDPELPYYFYDSLSAQYSFILPPGTVILPSGDGGNRINLRFIISAYSLSSIVEGTATYPLVISLDGEEHYAQIETWNSSEPCPSYHGLLFIRYAEHISDFKSSSFHLAGTFGFDVDDACGQYEVRSGRYDFIFPCLGNCP